MPGDKRAWIQPGALPLLAALVPEPHEVVLIDEAVEDIDFGDLRRFDVIGVTGQIVQRDRMRDILHALRDLPGKVVVGGPYASIDEGFFEGLCEAIFIGEADHSWPAFLDDLAQGRPLQARYEQTTPTDMTCLPTARRDLLKSQHYMSASIQYSRGCPFTCEFCDIIVIFGRRPRVKEPAQVVAELDAVHKAGFGVCFVVDDNFIGNKVAVKKMLPAIIDWQQAHGYPLVLSTEATLNLADDPELMDLMVEANFREVFIGIESPRAAALQETKKLQNMRGESMSVKLERIRDAGLVVSAGFIVGFDEDDAEIFEEQVRFIEENSIGQVSLGLLMALPKTPLHARLQAEGRLTDDSEMCNFIPRQMTREDLVTGCANTLRRLYTAEAFFGRILRNISVSEGFKTRRAEMVAREQRRGSARARADSLAMAFRLCLAMARARVLRRGVAMYLDVYRFQGVADRLSVSTFLSLCVLHWHHYRLTHLNAENGFARSMNYFNAAPVAAPSSPAAIPEPRDREGPAWQKS
ncbi:radical SAM protein [Roseovarius aestuariivivens]|uniref:radical SAM protein n=1 Tax=Roseovarius aestuariivivens TaxID=1888910 RepID=UPI001FDA1597|nr:radical SAM protein [Roseovarius aestuariivivens]